MRDENMFFLDQGKVGMILSVCADWTKMRMLVGHGEAWLKCSKIGHRVGWVGLLAPIFAQGQRYGFVELERWQQTEGLSCEATWLMNFTSTLCPCRFSRKYKQVVPSTCIKNHMILLE